MTSYDVIIIGGAITGTCTAFHLLQKSPKLRICICEADTTYRRAATALSTGGVRVLFSQPESILMSQYGHEFFGRFTECLRIADSSLDIAFRRQGYLFIANTAEQAQDLRLNRELQVAMGCDVLLLDPDELEELFAVYNTSDVVTAAYSPNDGWIDPMAAMQCLLIAVKERGAEIIHERVASVDHNDGAVTGITTATGRLLSCGAVVNATGAWTAELSRPLGMKLPISPLPRMVYFFRTEDPLPPLPLTLDGYGASFRPEGNGFICGVTEYGTVGEFKFEVDYSFFEEVVLPKLAHLVPAFERIKLSSAWVGHYDLNTFDGNVILGPWIGGFENYYVTAGSSGHGLQHAPAIGRAIAELIVDS